MREQGKEGEELGGRVREGGLSGPWGEREREKLNISLLHYYLHVMRLSSSAEETF